MISLIFKEAAQAIRRTPIICIMTALTIAMATGIGGVIAFLSHKANVSLDETRARLEIEAFFDPSAGSETASKATEKALSGIKGVAYSKFVSKEDAMTEYQKLTGEDAATVLGFNPLPASIRIHLVETNSENARATINKLKRVPGIEEVHFDMHTLSELEAKSKGLDQLTLLIGGLLLLSAIAFVHSTTRLAIYARRETIRTMELLGASFATMRAPFVIEGAASGLLGGALGAAIFALVGGIIFHEVAPGLEIQSYSLPNSAVLMGGALLGGVLLGAGVSVLSAMVSIRR